MRNVGGEVNGATRNGFYMSVYLAKVFSHFPFVPDTSKPAIISWLSVSIISLLCTAPIDHRTNRPTGDLFWIKVKKSTKRVVQTWTKSKWSHFFCLFVRVFLRSEKLLLPFSQCFIFSILCIWYSPGVKVQKKGLLSKYFQPEARSSKNCVKIVLIFIGQSALWTLVVWVIWTSYASHFCYMS